MPGTVTVREADWGVSGTALMRRRPASEEKQREILRNRPASRGTGDARFTLNRRVGSAASMSAREPDAPPEDVGGAWMPYEVTGYGFIVRAEFLGEPSLWCWEIRDRATGRLIESSWTAAWLAYESPAEAVAEGQKRLEAMENPAR
jgi:hypothetical protein